MKTVQKHLCTVFYLSFDYRHLFAQAAENTHTIYFQKFCICKAKACIKIPQFSPMKTEAFLFNQFTCIAGNAMFLFNIRWQPICCRALFSRYNPLINKLPKLVINFKQYIIFIWYFTVVQILQHAMRKAAPS